MNPDPKLPAFARQLSESYLSGEASQFLIHANVGDLVAWQDNGVLEYIPLLEFLHRFLARTKEIVIYYNLIDGLRFARLEMRAAFEERINESRKKRGEAEWTGILPAAPSRVLGLVGEFIGIEKQRAAVVINYLETLTPEGEMSYLGSEDRASLVAVQEWSRDPRLLLSDNIVVLVTENIMEINRRVRSSPQVKTIEVGLPDRDEREKFILHVRPRYPVTGLSDAQLADLTAGFSRVQIEGMFKNAAETDQIVSMEDVAVKKKEVIERECLNLVEVIEPRYGFESVGGMEEIKKTLGAVAGAIRRGERRRVPMGILLVGPMGTGKSFLAEAFARESGLTCVKLKSFREKWVGATEANLERILGIVQALGYVLVIIDEADRNLGSGDRDSDSGTESRVMARLKEFMSDGGHRGRIVFMVLTNRPDRLDVDLKRPGRLDLKIPMFYPESDGERLGVLRAVAKKYGFTAPDAALARAAAGAGDYSPADLEGLLVMADRLASEEGREKLEETDLAAALADFVPSRNALYIEFMEVLAAFETSSKRLLPERYRGLSGAELAERLELLRARMRL